MSETAREKTVLANGVDIFVRERGAGRPLLLINGIGGNADMWGPLEERLAGNATTVVFDTPGAGRSSTPRRPLSISDFARSRRRAPRRARPHRGRRARLLVRRARGTGAGPAAAGARPTPGTRRHGLRLGEQARDDGVAGADHDARPLPLPHRLRAHEPAAQPRRRGARRPSPAPHGGTAPLPAAAPRVRLSDDGRDAAGRA